MVPLYANACSGAEAPSGTNLDGCEAIHAEQNALLRASWGEMQGSTIYVTDKPCDGCRRMISGTPLARVVYPTDNDITIERNNDDGSR